MATKATKVSKSVATQAAAVKKPAPVKSKPVATAKTLASAKTTTSSTAVPSAKAKAPANNASPTTASAIAKTSTPTKASMPSKNTPATKASTAVTLPKAKAAVVKTATPVKSVPEKTAATIESAAPAAAPKAAKKSPKSNGDLSENNLPSEAELLLMPEDEYMSDRQLGFFRDRLRQLEQDILNNAGATTEHLRETQFVPDPADRATIEEEHALELRTRDRERKLLKKVQQSIVRIDSGEYGWCDETGEPIGLRRLLARPTATLSLEAQERREMRQKMFGD
jgi:DnaK suppressor protein